MNGLKDEFSTMELKAAKAAHEVNRAHCLLNGDTSQAPWGYAPEWQKRSILSGVRAAAENWQLTPEESHKKWMEKKLEDGWTYGPVKDVDIKQHPCMVPYSELPEQQRIKDAIFCAVVRAALSGALTIL